MRSDRGQATVDHLGVVACVAAALLGLGAFLEHAGVADLVRTAVTGRRAPGLDGADRATLIAALDGVSGAPGLDDAIAIAALGRDEEALRPLVAAVAYERYAPAALSRPLDQAVIEPNGSGRAAIVSPADERRRVAAENTLRVSRNRRQAAVLAAEVVVGVVTESVIVGIGAAIAGRLLGGPSAAAGTDLPPGFAAGDVVLCIPVRWRSLAPAAARVGIPPAPPGEAIDATTQPGRTLDASLVVIVRDGHELLRHAISGRACTGD
jgi:hypothetical protein